MKKEYIEDNQCHTNLVGCEASISFAFSKKCVFTSSEKYINFGVICVRMQTSAVLSFGLITLSIHKSLLWSNFILNV